MQDKICPDCGLTFTEEEPCKCQSVEAQMDDESNEEEIEDKNTYE